MKKLLMLCYYFPPLGMGGVQRPAKFAKYLADFGWQATVITVKPIAYWAQDASLLQELASVRIERTGSLDPQRLLYKWRGKPAGSIDARPQSSGWSRQILEKVLPFFFIPDSKMLWRWHVSHRVRQLLCEERYDALYTTAPPHSIHRIGQQLAQRFSLPWIADFRDGWVDGVVVREPTFWHRYRNIKLQQAVLQHADAVLAVSQGIADALRVPDKTTVIANGFDPDDFPKVHHDDDGVHICHCGSITSFSNPDVLFRALQLLQRTEPDLLLKLRIHYVGMDATGQFKDSIARFGLDKVVIDHGYLPHNRALEWVMRADALLMIALGKPGAHFIPGKTFEYLGSGKPILAVSNVADTCSLLRDTGAARLSAADDAGHLAEGIKQIARKQWPWFQPDLEIINRYNRKLQTGELAKLLNRITTKHTVE
jgi:glycosyltransferase involved in cell wall biosynthesis